MLVSTLLMLWQIVSLILIIVFVILAARLHKRRKEICYFERILDDNIIYFKPSTMYRANKGWKNKFKYMFNRVTRKNCDSYKHYV